MQIQCGCNASRSEAIKRVKENTIKYLAAGQSPIILSAQINHKELHGLNDPIIGRLIIPVEDVEEWDQDPDA
jgi:hypothetical protein